MRYLLDTNVISELIKREPNQNVVRWIDEHDETYFYLSVITLGELQKGINKLSDQNMADQLQNWLDQSLTRRFQGRLLDIDVEVISTWGRLQGASEKKGVKLPVIDSLIAATANTHNMIVVTRNVHDLELCQASVFNPW